MLVSLLFLVILATSATPSFGSVKVVVTVVAQKSDGTRIERLPIKLDTEVVETNVDGEAKFMRIDEGDHTLRVDSPCVVMGQVRYTFVKWSDGSGDNPRTITVIGDTTFTAILDAEYKLRTQIIPTDLQAELTAEPSSQDGFYSDGTAVNLTAQLNVGDMYFYVWSINGFTQTVGERVASVRMNCPILAVAIYRESYEHLLESRKTKITMSFPSYNELLIAVFALLMIGPFVWGCSRQERHRQKLSCCFRLQNLNPSRGHF